MSEDEHRQKVFSGMSEWNNVPIAAVEVENGRVIRFLVDGLGWMSFTDGHRVTGRFVAETS